MDEEFLEKEFYMKLLRMGNQHPQVKNSIRNVLKEIEKHREENEEDSEEQQESELP